MTGTQGSAIVTAELAPSFKEQMRNGVPQIGVRTQLCSPIVAEALGFCGFDYVYIDMEHSPNDLMSVLHQCQALAGTGAHPVVRLPTNDVSTIQSLLDIGVENLVVPLVETAEEARKAASAMRYPPDGIRSAARSHRGNRYGTLDGYRDLAARRLCLVVQIESRAAVGRIADIAAVDGVDGLLFGPADLAADLGHFGKTEHPEVVDMIEGGIEAILRAGKLAGMSSGDPALAPRWFDRGCRFVSVAGDLPMLVGQAKRAHATATARA
jgi:2-keto-3-deoxy-L-rhamnonate aldolase RhmA